MRPSAKWAARRRRVMEAEGRGRAFRLLRVAVARPGPCSEGDCAEPAAWVGHWLTGELPGHPWARNLCVEHGQVWAHRHGIAVPGPRTGCR